MNHEPLKKSVLLISLLLTAATVTAQTDSLPNCLSIGLDHLTHGELCDGGLPHGASFDPAESRSAFLLGRTRINAGYSRPGIEIRAVVQNKAIWGTDGNTLLRLYEGWTRFYAPCGLFAQIGRVALSYDDERIIGTNDFATAALSHDILRLGFENQHHKFHLILAYNQNAENAYSTRYYTDGAQFYKTMQTLWYHADLPRCRLGISLLFMNLGLQAGVPGNAYNPPSVQYQQFSGTYLNFHPKHLTLEASFYRQSGHLVQNLLHIPVDAWMASIKATVKPSDSYGFTLGYDQLSGDDYVPVVYGGQLGLPRHEVNRGFTPLYGSRAPFYGILDYYYESAYSNGFTPGLRNFFAGIFGKPLPQLFCSATWHYLAVGTSLQNFDPSLGHSVELQATYRFSPIVSLSAGYTQMIGTTTMQALKQGGDSRARWGWFSLSINPDSFTSRW